MTDRVLLIGIDGLDMDIFGNLLEEGDLPNISGIVQGGARAKLKSVLPLNSASAWTSMLTGRTPAGHGIFGFTRTHSDLLRRSTVRSDDIGAAPLWEIANQHQIPVGLINWPLTYPPPPLDGFVISGVPIPHNRLWAYPPELEEMLRDRFGPYLVDLAWHNLSDGTPGRRETFIANMYQMARKREEVTLWAMRNRPWRILAVIFTGTDRLLHSFWHLADPTHPSYDKPGAAAHGRDILRYFMLLDEIIGRIVAAAGKNVPVILASDHGFGPLHYRFYVRRWLENRRYLASLSRHRRNKAQGDEELDSPLKSLDLENTVAYPASLSESGIWINRAGRQPRGIVSDDDYEKLRERLTAELSECLPDGHRPVERIYRREEILSGPYINEAPDLLISPRDNYIVDDSPSPVEIAPSTHETATHRTVGIFAAKGNEFRGGVELDPLDMVDVLPTLLVTVGIPLPSDIEGSPALSVFESPPLSTRSDFKTGTRKRRDLKAPNDEEEAMKNHLKGIGYL